MGNRQRREILDLPLFVDHFERNAFGGNLIPADNDTAGVSLQSSIRYVCGNALADCADMLL